MTKAEYSADVFPLAAFSRCLPETRTKGFEFEKQNVTGAASWLSSTALWGCEYIYDETASGSLDQRFYASSYGRFLTADPAGSRAASQDDPGSWNRYSYTRGDPVNRLDPSGMDDFATGCGVIFADASLGYDAYSPCSGPGSGCPGANIAMALDLQDSPDSPTFYAQLQAMGCLGSYSAPMLTVAQSSAPQPTCDSVLLSEVQVFLQQDDPKLLGWDPNLASQFLSVGMTDGVDPRLMASIGTLESGHGGTFGGTNNPFGLGPGWNFTTPLSAVNSLGLTLKHLIGYGDNTVTKLYSGLSGISDSHRGFTQVPGYCQTSVSACVAAGGTVSGFLSSFAAAPGVGLAAGNPGNLKFPCPF